MVREGDPAKYATRRGSRAGRAEGRTEDRAADSRWLEQYNRLKNLGFSRKVAAFGATAAVYGFDIARKLDA